MWDNSEDDDWPDEEDWPDSDEDASVISCPECGGEDYEEADLCPHCGNFLLPATTHPLMGKPAWFVLLGVVGILATIAALSGLF